MISLPEPKCYCPDCGESLQLTEESASRFLKDMSVFVGKCKNGHSWEVTEDHSDMGRVKITQILETDKEDPEDDDDEDEISGVEVDINIGYN